MNFFQKYLSVWVILCMIIGVSIGHFFPMIPNILNKFEYAGISIPTIDISADIYVSVGSYSEKSYTHNTDCNTFDNSDIFDLWNRIRSVLSVKTATQYCSTCRNDRSI